MFQADFLSITLQLANFGVGLIMIAIAGNLWVYKIDGIALWVAAGFGICGITFIIVALYGARDLTAIEALLRIIRQVLVAHISILVYVYIGNNSGKDTGIFSIK